MGAIDEFGERHALVGIDTPLFIYHFERAENWLPVSRAILGMLVAGVYRAVTSVITLTELITLPLASGRADLANEYSRALRRFPNLSLLEIDAPIARQAAGLRRTYRLRTPDALQLAASLQAGATGFITNDHRLRQVREIDVLVLDDVVGSV